MKKLNFKSFVLLVVSMCMLNFAIAKDSKVGTDDKDVKWTSIGESISAAKNGNKKFIMVDLYTDWCGWCKKMDENTFQDPTIITLLNENFISVKLNAETTNSISFNGRTYDFKKTGARGANQLAMDLGSVGGKLGYPTLVILDVNGNKLQAFPGYKDVETLTAIIKYYKSESYKKMDFLQFQTGE